MKSVVLSPFVSDHDRAICLPHNEFGDQRHYFSSNNPPPHLTAEAKEWADNNTPGYVVEIGARGTTFLIELLFKSERDAMLFKLFWL